MEFHLNFCHFTASLFCLSLLPDVDRRSKLYVQKGLMNPSEKDSLYGLSISLSGGHPQGGESPG